MTSARPTPAWAELEVFIRREDAERFVEGVRGDDPGLASYLGIEERDIAYSVFEWVAHELGKSWL